MKNVNDSNHTQETGREDEEESSDAVSPFAVFQDYGGRGGDEGCQEVANEEEEGRSDEVVVLFVRTESVLGEEYD